MTDNIQYLCQGRWLWRCISSLRSTFLTSFYTPMSLYRHRAIEVGEKKFFWYVLNRMSHAPHYYNFLKHLSCRQLIQSFRMGVWYEAALYRTGSDCPSVHGIPWTYWSPESSRSPRQSSNTQCCRNNQNFL